MRIFLPVLIFSIFLTGKEVAGKGIIRKDIIQKDTLPKDTAGKILPEVVINAFEQNRPLKDVGASVSIIGRRELDRYGNTSLLPAVNATPGIKMEERSPGSYRLNIRGSSLRSPFGVRNVKIYLDGIPFTDPGGNTYFNQLSFYDVAGMEIIKGPGSSLYGAGTGGVVLLNSREDSGTEANPSADSSIQSLNAHFVYGSYSSYTGNANASFIKKNDQYLIQNKISYTHQQSKGYRDHSDMRRDIASWQTQIRAGRRTLSAYILYGDMYYQTPGGLTEAQYRQNPRAARTAAGIFPGAADNKAAIYQRTFWSGIQQRYSLSEHWENQTAIYGAFSQIRNPAILNYERRLEPHFGGRTSFHYHTSFGWSDLSLVAGGEIQQGFPSVKVYENNTGTSGALQTDDEVNSRIASIFLQAELSLPNGWITTTGISGTNSSLRFTRLSESPVFTYHGNFYNEWSPRFSVLKKINSRLSAYGVVSKGFSPPTVAELLPSTSVINTGLQAEQGVNYEAGMRGSFLQNQLSIDLSGYYFSLKKAITQRRDLSGADYFVNAGSTRQQGIELTSEYRFLLTDKQFLTGCSIWLNYTFTHYRYKQFNKDEDNFSGNRIPGVAPNTLSTGVSFNMNPGIYGNINASYNDAIYLNDANTSTAEACYLLGFRIGYKIPATRKFNPDLFISGNNLLDERYSLGYDLNAAGGRFYNAAPGRNFELGLSIHIR